MMSWSLANMEPFWFILAVALAATSMGAKGLLGLIFALIALVIGALMMMIGVGFSRNNHPGQLFVRNMARQSWTWFRSPYVSNERLKRNEADAQAKRLTWDSASLTGRQTFISNAMWKCSSIDIFSGAPQIDEPLNLILSYVFRDYIYPWHFKLTHDRAFPIHLKDSINYLVTNLSMRIRVVDWIPFLTTRLVDDVASHVRLFKKARYALQTRKNPTEDGGKILDLESLCF